MSSSSLFLNEVDNLNLSLAPIDAAFLKRPRASFLNLPLELRLHIYSFIIQPLVYAPHALTRTPHKSYVARPVNRAPRCNPNSYALVLVCKATAAEVLDLLYNHHPVTFIIGFEKVTGFHWWPVSDTVLAQIKTCRFRYDFAKQRREDPKSVQLDVEILVEDLVKKLPGLVKMEAEYVMPWSMAAKLEEREKGKAVGESEGAAVWRTIRPSFYASMSNVFQIPWEEMCAEGADPDSTSYVIM